MVSSQPRARTWKKRREDGLSLIEVLIALLVLAIGFLTTASLQGLSLSRTTHASQRQAAVVATYSILDVMRTDLNNAKAGGYNQTVTVGSCGDDDDGPDGALAQWCQHLGKALGETPTTQGKVDCTNTGRCTITVTYHPGGTKSEHLSTLTTTTFL